MADTNPKCTNGGLQNDILSVSSASRPNFLDTFNRDTHYPSIRSFCQCLSIAEIVSLTRTCKPLSDLYQYLLPILWDVDKALGRYFDDPVGFRSQMAESNALIFGKFPAQFFERAIWESEPLEIIIKHGKGADLFRRYLEINAGYSETDRQEFPLTGFCREIRTFKRKSDSKTAIHLLLTNHPPIAEILYESRVTAGSSLMSWNRAYSLFALPTSIQHKNYQLGRFVNGKTDEAARQYSERGWQVQDPELEEDNGRNHPFRQRRRIGDRYTWTIPFNTDKVKCSTIPDYVLEHSYFSIDRMEDQPGHCGLERDHGSTGDATHVYYPCLAALSSKVLRHVYTLPEDGMIDSMRSRLRESTFSELSKLDPAQRPNNYDDIASDCSNIDEVLKGFDPPASWTYHDDEMPIWCKEYEERNPEPNSPSKEFYQDMSEKGGRAWKGDQR